MTVKELIDELQQVKDKSKDGLLHTVDVDSEGAMLGIIIFLLFMM